jgi:hypothetical protein
VVYLGGRKSPLAADLATGQPSALRKLHDLRGVDVQVVGKALDAKIVFGHASDPMKQAREGRPESRKSFLAQGQLSR